MRTLTSVLFVVLVVISAESMLAGRLQQNENQNASPEQQAQPTSPQGQAIGRVSPQGITGCVVQSDHGYLLKTDNDAYPIETDQDLSHYVNKRVKVTGILEHHTTPAPSVAGANTGITDLRLRMVAKIIGDCNPPSK